MKRTSAVLVSLCLVGILLFTSIGTPFTPKVHALSGSDFKAGRIIDDGTFFDPNSMSASEIQTFLESKVPSCDTNGQQLIYDSTYGDTVTRAVYSQRRGVSTPFTCLRDYSQTTVAKPAESDICNGYPQVTQKASDIIYGVAQSCGINPHVLIVLLQKEQTLITDDWPWPVQYRSATGYGCPDTAACDSQYYGFFNQVYSAARQFKNYAKNASSFYYYANKNNYIQYNPSTSCGGSTVYIENQATAGLYNYTPYQPNAAALSGLSDTSAGGGDSCSAYGNRNFWWYYNRWFGTTYAPQYSASIESSGSYTDQTATTGKSTTAMTSGDKAYIVVRVRNTGNTTWQKTGTGSTLLGTTGPEDRISAFSNESWVSPNRAAHMQEDSVAPGQVATFAFWYRAPYAGGDYNEQFSVVLEGRGWVPYFGFYLGTHVETPSFAAQTISAGSYADNTMQQGKPTTSMAPLDRAYISVKVKNTGNLIWRKSGFGGVLLATTGPNDRISPFRDSTWISGNRAAVMQEDSVAPGQTATFGFWYKAPLQGAQFHEAFTLVMENIGWFPYFGFNLNTTVPDPSFSAQTLSAGSYTDATQTVGKSTLTMTGGDKAYIVLKVKNTGNVTWTKTGTGGTLLATTGPNDRISPFRDSTWISGNRAAVMQEDSVAPGQTATFGFWYKAPLQAGSYNEKYSVVHEGLAWTPYFGFNLNTQVTATAN